MLTNVVSFDPRKCILGSPVYFVSSVYCGLLCSVCMFSLNEIGREMQMLEAEVTSWPSKAIRVREVWNN